MDAELFLENRFFARFVTASVLSDVGLFDQVLGEASELAAVLYESRRLGRLRSRRGNIVRRTPKGRIIHTETKGGVRREYHATKGWRSRRVEAA